MQYSAIRKMAQMSSQAGIISFSAGAPSVETFPAEEILGVTSKVLAGESQCALQYGATLGHSGLIDAVMELCAERGLPGVRREEVAITGGSQQALDLLGRILVDPGDTVFFELPSYIGAISVFRNLQARMVGVRQADDGIEIEDLVARIRQIRGEGGRAKVIYLIPNFQNPSGVTLSPAKRRKLLEVADEYDLLLVEDDPYGEVYFDSSQPADLVPVKSFDLGGRVIYISTFSKILAPGLRTGWVVAAAPIIEKLDLAKQACDLCGSMLDQRIVAECWKQGIIQKHLPGIRVFYQAKCRAMLNALVDHMPAGIQWTRPAGGLFLWLSLPRHLDSGELLLECLESERVSYVIGQPFHVNGEGSHTMRLAFSRENEDNIALGVQRLARVFKSHPG